MKYVARFMVVLSVIALLFSTGYAKTGPTSDQAYSSSQETSGYPNSELLVTTEWLAKNLNAKNLVIIDARANGYNDSHIQGAISLNYSDCTATSGVKSITDLETRLSALGLRKDMKYVIYDDATNSSGKAGGVFWVLEYLGCKDVHVLNGGWDKWVLEGRPKTTKKNELSASKFVATPQKDIRASRDRISNRLRYKDFVLIDARNDEGYNGWQINGEKRGGHIPGAVNVNYTWFYNPDKTVLKYEDMKDMLESRGISADKEVIAYCSTGTRSGFTYFVLRLMGYPRCSNYDGTIVEWAANASLPMEKLARYEKLVYPAWVKDLMDGKNPPSYPGKGYVILEARYTGFSISQPGAAQGGEYIPGAISIDPGYVEHENDASKYYPNYTQPGDGNLLSGDRLREAIAKLGISKDTTVVVYGNGKIIPMTAARVAWALMYAGVEDVRIMNGGFPAWTAAGYPVVTAPATPVAIPDFGSAVPVHQEYVATTDYVREISEGQNEGSSLVDVRKLEEYKGEINSYPFFDKKGHIPNAVWMGDWNTLTDTDNTFRSYTEVQGKWEKLGITPDREPVFYCGTGWRSSVGFYQAYLMGFAKMRNYDGSFYEWSWNANNPLSLDPPQ